MADPAGVILAAVREHAESFGADSVTFTTEGLAGFVEAVLTGILRPRLDETDRRVDELQERLGNIRRSWENSGGAAGGDATP